MNDTLNPWTHPVFESLRGGQYRSVRTYGEILLLSLLILHGMAFIAFRWVERNEMKSELAAFADTLPQSGFGQHSADIIRYPDGIIVARRGDSDNRAGFSEEVVAGNEYFVYALPGSDIIVAKSEHDLDREVERVGTILAVLFAAEVMILFGWWSFMKEKIREMFSV